MSLVIGWFIFINKYKRSDSLNVHQPTRSLSMLKGEVLPQIVRKQFRKPAMKNENEAPHGDPSFLTPNNKRGEPCMKPHFFKIF